MIQKPIAISVIAAVGVAGILTLSVLAAISSTNQAFARASTDLSLRAVPNKGEGEAVRVDLSGKLTSEGSPVGGVWVYINAIVGRVKTNDDGSYSTFAELGPGKHGIHASFPGDATHGPSSATISLACSNFPPGHCS